MEGLSPYSYDVSVCVPCEHYPLEVVCSVPEIHLCPCTSNIQDSYVFVSFSMNMYTYFHLGTLVIAFLQHWCTLVAGGGGHGGSGIADVPLEYSLHGH